MGLCREPFTVWAVYDSVGWCEPHYESRMLVQEEMEMATLRNDDDDDHESAIPAEVGQARFEGGMCCARPKSASVSPWDRSRSQVLGPGFPYFFGEGRHEIEFRQACTDRRCAL